MKQLEQLRKLAEVIKEQGPAWYRPGMLFDLLGAAVLDTEQCEMDAAYIAAASPDVVLGLLNRIAELEAANRSCVDAVAEWGAKAGALQAEVYTAEVYAKKLYRERDEAGEAVKRLAGALEPFSNLSSAYEPREPHDESVHGWGDEQPFVADFHRAADALADPVVRKIVEGE